MLKIWLLVLWGSMEVSAHGCNTLPNSHCTCSNVYYDHRKYYQVNCTGLGVDATSYLDMIPPETEWLIFTSNTMIILKEGMFVKSRCKNLKIVDLTNNAISTITNDAFNHLTNVTRLILNHNQIDISYKPQPLIFSKMADLEELHLTDAFLNHDDLPVFLRDYFAKANLTKLYKLHLEQNEIWKFQDPSVFCELRFLHDLYAGSNNIVDPTFNVHCLKNLRYLDFESNRIRTLKTDQLSIFDQVADLTINLNQNSFNCDEGEDLYDWLARTRVKVVDKDDLKCWRANTGRMFNFNLKKFWETKRANFSKSLAVLIGVCGFVIASVLAALVCMHKNKIGDKFSASSKRVHYTTIHSSEDVDV